MSQQFKKPLAVALSATFLAAAIAPAISQADTNPFVTNILTSGYDFGDQAEGKCGEGTCGENIDMGDESDDGGDDSGDEAGTEAEG